ncbi:hypothetical protein SDC9_135891 [bioreactor metagenome]|uniref:Uncharacterized protein n=1 Tax=bioreactor metagenome TaxID=1076179 RepID=A0A645DHP5_9ZZZZ
MAHYDDIRAHRLKGPGGIAHRLALRGARAGDRPVDDVGGEHLFRKFKGDPRARGILKEEVDAHLAAKRGDLFGRTVHHVLHMAGLVEEEIEFLSCPAVKVYHAAMTPGHLSDLIKHRAHRSPPRPFRRVLPLLLR